MLVLLVSAAAGVAACLAAGKACELLSMKGGQGRGFFNVSASDLLKYAKH